MDTSSFNISTISIKTITLLPSRRLLSQRSSSWPADGYVISDRKRPSYFTVLNIACHTTALHVKTT